MPLHEKHPIADHMRERSAFDCEPLQSLLRAYKTAVMHGRWKAVEAIESAIYRAREDEINSYADKLEQHTHQSSKDSNQ